MDNACELEADLTSNVVVKTESTSVSGGKAGLLMNILHQPISDESTLHPELDFALDDSLFDVPKLPDGVRQADDMDVDAYMKWQSEAEAHSIFRLGNGTLQYCKHVKVIDLAYCQSVGPECAVACGVEQVILPFAFQIGRDFCKYTPVVDAYLPCASMGDGGDITAFSGCPDLKVLIWATSGQAANEVVPIEGIDESSDLAIYVNDSMVDAYKSHGAFANLKDRIHGVSSIDVSTLEDGFAARVRAANIRLETLFGFSTGVNL
jgi:hypothetical protein